MNAADPDAAKEDPELLVQKLQHDVFDVRNHAAEKLASLGEAARPVLEKAAASSEDAQLKETALSLLARLNKSSLVIMAFDRDGKPAAGAEADVRIYRQFPQGNWNDNGTEQTTIGEDGRAVLPDQPAGPTNIQFTWKKWFPPQQNSQYFNANMERGPNPMLVTLTRGATVTGRVLDDAQPGRPVKDAQVSLYLNGNFSSDLLDLEIQIQENWGGQQNRPMGNTDEKGLLKLESVPEGCYQVVVKCDGKLSTAGPFIRVREGETVEFPNVKMVAKQSGKVSLKLLKADGSPLKKTRVSLDLEYQYDTPDAPQRQRLARKLKVQLGMRRPQEAPETDDDGKLTVEDLRPGKYKLNARASGIPPWPALELTVEADKTVDLGELKAITGGSVTGKLLGSDGKGFANASVEVVPEQDYDEEGSDNAWRYNNRVYTSSSAGQTNSDGTFDVRNLAPGKYTLTVHGRRNYNGAFQPAAVIYGVEVASGKATTTPPVTVSTLNIERSAVKGTVLLAGGEPAAHASVQLVSGNSRSGNTCDDQGNFNFSHYDTGMTATKVVAKAPGYKQQVVDLTERGLKTDALKITLEKHQFGGLRVKVVDADGAPLPDATVRPFGTRGRNQYQSGYYNTPQDRKVITNRKGEASFMGLAAGPRCIQVEKDGYYAAAEVQVVVAPNADSEVVVTLLRGYSVAGHIEQPAGFAFNNALVSLNGARSRTMFVKDDGHFEFSGLAPGDYNVTVVNPGLVFESPKRMAIGKSSTGDRGSTGVPAGKLELPTGTEAGATTPELKVRMVEQGAAALQAGARFHRYTASLVVAGSWNPKISGEISAANYAATAPVDATGRVEFSGVVPGIYDVLLTAPNERQNYYYYGYANQQRRVPAFLVAPRVEVKAVKRAAEVATMPAAEAGLVPGTGSIAAHVVCDAPLAYSGSLGTLAVVIVGEKAGAIDFISLAQTQGRQSAGPPVVVGTPPPGARKPLEAGTILFQNLPPGEYQIYARMMTYNAGRRVDMEKEAPVPIHTLIVKEGETTETGTLNYPVPPAILNAAIAAEDWQNESAEADDQVKLFQP